MHYFKIAFAHNLPTLLRLLPTQLLQDLAASLLFVDPQHKGLMKDNDGGAPVWTDTDLRLAGTTDGDSAGGGKHLCFIGADCCA